MLYGNSSNGYGYSPDRRNDRVNYNNLQSQFLGANGSRQTGYYSSGNNYSYKNSKKSGWYDGAGRYHND